MSVMGWNARRPAVMAQLCVATFVFAIGATALAAKPPPVQLETDAAGWTVVFRSDNSLIWNTDAGEPSLPNGFSVKPERAPEKLRYVRLKRMDTGDAVILPMERKKLGETQDNDDDFIWSGGAMVRGPVGNHNRILGVAKRSWSATKPGDHLVARESRQIDRGYRGWGFSKEAKSSSLQTYSWAGASIEKTVFEIAVKSDALSDDEKGLLLTDKDNSGVFSDAALPKADSPPGESNAASPRIARRQSSIHALTVSFDKSGSMTGGTLDLILTATPGPARTGTPVSFVTPVGKHMQFVLGDVLRTVRLKYPKWEASKVELSFDDRYSKLDGESIGAALGTLILSMLEGYEIDPKLAMTGDVTADGKVRSIGGVVAKTRGATGSGCALIAMPAGNYDQVADGLVYEGTALLTNIQIIGIATLEEATRVARSDREVKLKEAIDLFADVQERLKKTPERLRSKEITDKLSQIAELAPNHISARLLLLAAQDKQPKKLSATASLYYTSVAVRGVLPALYEGGKGKIQVTPTVVKEGIKSLEKVRRLADPSVYPLVDAWKEFVRVASDAQAGRASAKDVEGRAQAVLDASAKLNANRDVMEKMLREGI